MTYQLLDRLRVFESSAFIAAPLAGLTLAQFGADVIRLDRIGGGIDYARLPRMPDVQSTHGRSLYWTGLNKGKRSIAVDVSRPEGRELARDLITAPGSQGGVLLTNMGTPWLSHGLLAALRPDLVSCTIQGNADGSTAVDYTVNCAVGYPAITGPANSSAPINHVFPAWDVACAYQAAFAMVAAVSHRQRTGQGAELRLALSDVALATLSHLGITTEVELLDSEREPIGNHIYGAFGRDFVTADQQRVMVAAISSAQWNALVKACDAGPAMRTLSATLSLDFSDEAQRYQGRDAIASALEPWFAARSLAEVARVLEQHRVCWGPYQTVRELLAHDARASLDNPLFEHLNTQGVGTHLSAGATPNLIGVPRQPTTSAPLIGQDTDQILFEVLGLDAGPIGRLHDQGVVAGPECDPSFKA